MKTLIYGAGPIGQWLALRLHEAGGDVTLMARGSTFDTLERDGVVIVDGLTGERQAARPKLVDGLDPHDRYNLVIVAMQRSSRIAVCPALAHNPHLEHILFLGNDVDGFRRYLEHLPAEKVLLGFPGAGGGFRGDDLVVMDREHPAGPHGEIYIGELDGRERRRTREIEGLFEKTGIKVSIERDIDGWLKYHFAFMAPTVGAILARGGDLRAVADDPALIHDYCRACREAGNVLRAVGKRRRQPRIFNLYYWLPRWLEPRVFSKLFGSPAAEIRFGLHARSVGPELLELAAEFDVIKGQAGMDTPTLDGLIRHARPPHPAGKRQEVT